jgi:hypothetical protein
LRREKPVTPEEAREHAVYFIEEIWPKVSSLGDPWRGLKTLSLSMAHDILDLTEGERVN